MAGGILLLHCFQFSGTNFDTPGEQCKSKRLGIEKASSVMGSAKVAEWEQTWQHGMLFHFSFSCTNFFLSLFLAGEILATMF